MNYKIKKRGKIGWPITVLILSGLCRIAGGSVADMGYIILAASALRGGANALAALLCLFYFSSLNTAIVPAPSLGSVNRYVVLFCAIAGQLRYVKLKSQANQLVLQHLAIGGLIVIHSLIASQTKDVSIAKAINWTACFTVVSSIFANAEERERNEYSRAILQSLRMCALISAPLLAIESVGYARNGTGFQGILDHPQLLGPVMALLVSWEIGDILTKKRASAMQYIIAGLSVAMIVKTESRTGILACIGGVAIILAKSMTRNQPLSRELPGLFNPRTTIALASILGLLVSSPEIISVTYKSVVIKRSEIMSASVTEAYRDSRGSLMSLMYQNIRDKPLTGIGFGVATDPRESNIIRDPIFNIPLSAVVEKGSAPFAIIEELGIPLGTLIILWISSLQIRAFRRSATGAAVVATTLLINLGESVFFSVGGLGLICGLAANHAVHVPERR